MARAYRRIGFDDPSWAHHLARIDGQPVGTASTYRDGLSAGLYFLATVPAKRGQGVASALAHKALGAALVDRYEVGVLGASSQGFGLYRRLGFEEQCRFEIVS